MFIDVDFLLVYCIFHLKVIYLKNSKIYIDRPHLNLIAKFEFEPNLIVTEWEPELEHEPYGLGRICCCLSTPCNLRSLDTSSVHSDHGE